MPARGPRRSRRGWTCPERDLFDRAVPAAVAHVRGLLDADEATLERAAEGRRQAPEHLAQMSPHLVQRPLAAAAAQEDLARLADVAGRPRDIARWLRQALGLALSCGAMTRIAATHEFPPDPPSAG